MIAIELSEELVPVGLWVVHTIETILLWIEDNPGRIGINLNQF